MALKSLEKKILAKIVPSKSEAAAQKRLAETLLEKIRSMQGKHIEVKLAGSIARDTHLKGDHDLDIFVLFPEETSREEFEKEGLRIGKAVFRGHEWEKAYSEHPYIRGKISGFNVEVVPAYKVRSASELKSAVDRTVFHNEYVKQKLGAGQKNEVRLLKQFLKGIGAYGADLKASSVPGYVTELLTLKYGSFEEAIKTIAKWKEHETIDLENQLSEEEARKKFDSPLIIVDPVDKNRNVAAALSLNQFARIIAASRTYTQKPSERFFFKKKTKPLQITRVKKLVEKEGLITIEIGYPKGELSDVLWGQIRRLSRKIVAALNNKDFKVLRNAEWSDEKECIILVFDLEANRLEKAMKRIGPPVTEETHSGEFLKAHKKALSGPRIEQGRWVVETERADWKATEFLKKFLGELRRTENGSIRKALNKKARLLSDPEVMAKYRRDKAFQEWFSAYLRGKEEF